MTRDERTLRHEIEKVEARLAWLQQEIDRQQGKRDRLLAELLDFEGASDKRFIGVR